MPAPDILFTLPSTVKARTDEIVIRNNLDPASKRIDHYQSVRPMSGDKAGAPIRNFLTSTPITKELLDKEFGGVTGWQVLQWHEGLANELTNRDAPAVIAQLAGNTVEAPTILPTQE
jgi:hypothetical protein